MAHFKHRALRHHSAGIFEAEAIFGTVITNSDGKVVPVRFIGEQHVREDCGGIIPSVSDWLRGIEVKRWMSVGQISDGDYPQEGDGVDLSVEKWREEVAAGRTILGHSDWIRRHSARSL